VNDSAKGVTLAGFDKDGATKTVTVKENATEENRLS